MRRFGWYYLRLDLPDSWEARTAAVSPRDGEMSLGNRAGETLQYHWHLVDDPLDVGRRLIDLARPHGYGHLAMAELQRRVESVGDWQALLPTAEEPKLAGFATRWMQETGELLLLVFPAHPDSHAGGQRQILRSSQPNHGDERLWAAFGLEIVVPAAYDLTEVELAPARQRFRFAKPGEGAIGVARYAMDPPAMSLDDLERFVAVLPGYRPHLRRLGTVPREPAEGIVMGYATHGDGHSLIGRLLGPRWDGRLWAWHRPEGSRLYLVEHHARPPCLLNDLYRQYTER